MTKDQVFKIVDTKVREVAQVFSQNSTALAREFTLNMAIGEIKDAVIEMLLHQEENLDGQPKPKGKKNS